MTRAAHIECVLFYRSGPVTHKELAKLLEIAIEDVQSGIAELREVLAERGVVLVETDTSIALATHPECHELIEAIEKKERGGPLSKAALETLAVILYSDGVTKAYIDYVRGVNAQFILRSLMVRGLIEKKENKEDKRSPLYIPTLELFNYLGVESRLALPHQEQTETFLSELNEQFHAHTEG